MGCGGDWDSQRVWVGVGVVGWQERDILLHTY